MKKLLALVLIGLGWLWPLNCWAIESTEPSAESAETVTSLELPQTLNFGRLIERGCSYSTNLKVKNTGEKEAKLQLSFAPSEYDVADEAKLAVDWLAIAGGQVRQTIPAGEEKAIRVRVTLPADVTDGSQYATLVVKTDNAEEKVAVRLDIVGEDAKATGALKKSSLRIISFNDRLHAGAVIKNTGKIGFTVHHFVQAKKGVSGTAEWRTLLDEEMVALPERDLKLNSDSAEAVGYGWHTIEQKISYVNAEGETMELTRTQLVLNCPGWLGVIFGALLLALIVVAVVLLRKKRAQKTLAKAKN